MRALREHPRITVVKTLSIVLLVAASAAAGALINADDGGHVHALETRLASTRHSLTMQGAELRTARMDARRAGAATSRAEANLNTTRRANRRLRDKLAAERRAPRHAKNGR
jgi:hypothetical protein